METCCLAVSMTLQNMKSPFVCKYVCMHSFMYCVHMWVMSAACISGSCVSTFGFAVVCVCACVRAYWYRVHYNRSFLFAVFSSHHWDVAVCTGHVRIGIIIQGRALPPIPSMHNSIDSLMTIGHCHL